MPGTLQPLDKKFAIVDKFGNPTDYFVRWAQQKQIDITGAIALSDLVAYLDAHQLIAGVGIQFAPGPNGDLNQSPTIHADVQAILDEITATRGAVLYRGLGGWAALLPGTAGYLLSTNGAGADPSWVAPPSGGGGKPWYWLPPHVADFGADSFGTLTRLDDPNVGYVISSQNSMNHMNVVAQALPAAGTSWTATMHMVGGVMSANYGNIGFCFYNAAHTKFFFVGQDSRSCMHMYRYNAGGFDGWEVLTGVANTSPSWFRVRYTAVDGNAHFDWSYDGVLWMQDMVIHNVKADIGADPQFIGPCTQTESSQTATIGFSCDYWKLQ